MPTSCLEISMLVSIHIEKNGTNLGTRQVKCESRMRELDQLLRSMDNPIDFICQTMGFASREPEQLDTFLVTAFQRNIPPNFNLLQFHGHPTNKSSSSTAEYPTLLHFAARFGLEKLAWKLMDCPGGDVACELRNVCDLTPADMAEKGNHLKLANALRSYMQMTEFTSMYSYLKVMSEGNKTKGSKELEYHRPRPLSETYQVPKNLNDCYQIPPAARPFSPGSILSGRSSVPTTPTEAVSRTFPGVSMASPVETDAVYLDMNVTGQRMEPVLDGWKPEQFPISPVSTVTSDSFRFSPENDKNNDTTSGKSHEHLHSEDELLEIINDFKNNVFTIAEAEKLVDNWKNRNDVQKSFKDKQIQLNEMREEYERIQQQMKEQMKRPTPFERVRNFFRGKSKEKDNGGSKSCQTTVNGNKTNSPPVSQRPASSLSLHSTCSSLSSGRMSTVSGCSRNSMGDSGTHSDNDDHQKNQMNLFVGSKANKCQNGIQNYEVPPAPRPVLAQNDLFSGCKKSNSLLELPQDRPPFPTPRPPLDSDSSDAAYVLPDTNETDGKTTSASLDDLQHKISVHKGKEESIEQVFLFADEEVVEVKHNYMNVECQPDHKNDIQSEKVKENGTTLEKKKGNFFEPDCSPHYLNINCELGVILEGSANEMESNLPKPPTDLNDLPNYVNVMIESLPPPIPSRCPTKKKIF